MKDILVFSTFYKPHLGGVEKYVENFYKKLPNHRVTVITSKYDKALKSHEMEGNLRIIRLPCFELLKDKYYIPTLRGVKKIKKLVNECDANKTEIHTHTRFYLTNFIATKLAKRYNLKHYHFEHGSSFVQDGSLFIRFCAYIFDMTLARYILRNSDLIFPISKSVKRFLEEHYKNLKFGPVLYNSYEFRDKEFIRKAKPKVPKLLFVGRLVKAKGVYELLGACKILKGKDFKFTLTIIGDGSERENMEQYIKENNLEKEIIMRGKLPYEKTQREYQKHHIFINPSYTEGLPTTVLEAFFNNLLIIATDVGGTNEIIPKKLLIKKEDLSPNNLAKHIKDTFNKWRKLKSEYESIYRGDKEKFSWRENVKKFEKVNGKIL